MQSLDVISINIWQIIISLVNLLILFFILKKFLYKPVREMLAKRQAAVDEVYSLANEALEAAHRDREEYEQKLLGADEECDELLRTAQQNAARRSGSIIKEAEEKAAGMIRRAENEIELEKNGATAEMKHQIAELSVQLAEKLLEREMNADDHREFIDSFINSIGTESEGSNVGDR